MQKSPSSLSKIGALNAKSRLMEMKAQSSDKLILGHLNINSIQNKFEALKFIIGNNIDILLISETKLDDSFPSAQFLIKGFLTDLIEILRAVDYSFISAKIYHLKF